MGTGAPQIPVAAAQESKGGMLRWFSPKTEKLRQKFGSRMTLEPRVAADTWPRRYEPHKLKFDEFGYNSSQTSCMTLVIDWDTRAQAINKRLKWAFSIYLYHSWRTSEIWFFCFNGKDTHLRRRKISLNCLWTLEAECGVAKRIPTYCGSITVADVMRCQHEINARKISRHRILSCFLHSSCYKFVRHLWSMLLLNISFERNTVI